MEDSTLVPTRKLTFFRPLIQANCLFDFETSPNACPICLPIFGKELVLAILDRVHRCTLSNLLSRPCVLFPVLLFNFEDFQGSAYFYDIPHIWDKDRLCPA